MKTPTESSRRPPCIVWFTGLSGAGKSTLAFSLACELVRQGQRCKVLDGDDLRASLCADLGFSRQDREENVRRIADLAETLADDGMVVLVACISPFRASRDAAQADSRHAFHEIYCSCPLEVCEARDVKGLYRKARQGMITQFTGINSPYEPPLAPALALDTSQMAVEQGVSMLLDLLNMRFEREAS